MKHGLQPWGADVPCRRLIFLFGLTVVAIPASAQSGAAGEPKPPAPATDAVEGPAPEPTATAPSVRRFELLSLSPEGAIRIRMIPADAKAAAGGNPQWLFSLRIAQPLLDETLQDKTMGALETVDGSDPSATAELFRGIAEGDSPGPCWIECFAANGGVPRGDPVDRAILWLGEVSRWLQDWNEERKTVVDVIARWKGEGNPDDYQALTRVSGLSVFLTPRGLHHVFRQENYATLRNSTVARKGGSPEPPPLDLSLTVKAADPLPVTTPGADDEKISKEDDLPPGASDGKPLDGGNPPPEVAGQKTPGAGDEPTGEGKSPAPDSPNVTPGPAGAAAQRSDPMRMFIDQFRRETLASLLLAAEAVAETAALPGIETSAASTADAEPPADLAALRDWNLLKETYLTLKSEEAKPGATAEGSGLPTVWDPPPARRTDWPAAAQRVRAARLKLEKGF